MFASVKPDSARNGGSNPSAKGAGLFNQTSGMVFHQGETRSDDKRNKNRGRSIRGGVKVNKMLRIFQRNDAQNVNANINVPTDHELNNDNECNRDVPVTSSRKKIYVAKYPFRNGGEKSAVATSEDNNFLENRNPENGGKSSPQDEVDYASKRFILSSPEIRDDELRERIERHKIERLHSIRLKQKHDKAESMHQHRIMKESSKKDEEDASSRTLSVNTPIDEFEPTVADPRFSVQPVIPEHKRSVEELPLGSPNGKKIRTSEQEGHRVVEKNQETDPVLNPDGPSPFPKLSRW
eukprot:CAMPEP_0116045702 /NCGR_PEP_ID=MMETSP0321-20121206/27776_1 /TAXON_ID=163516 /ORGANISM="Leptocylindrus danicus var. danicus, Strain B650" /LENGTH=293 /DNA_ID=CAMNT_0003527087 /DNA_START=45 /DNA_END=923 /DNA_ORIENTATION=-